MTDQELKDLVASLSVSQRETDRQLKETGQQLKETEKLVASLSVSQGRTDQRQEETDRQLKETWQQLKETDRQLKESGKQIGGLGDKFGSFTEGLALPSMARILGQRFGMDVIAPRVRAQNKGESMEVDVLAWSRTRDEVYVVEVKSHLRAEALNQMRKTLRRFHDFYPGHEGKKVYGILAAVDAPPNLRDKVLREGIYLARVHDGLFELQVPEDFQPRAY